MTSTPRMTEHSIGRLLLAMALVSAAVLVFPGLATSPLGIDEHVSYWIAGAENPGTIWNRSLNYAATPPLSSFLQRGFLDLIRKSTFWFRLPSVIGFLGGIGFTFLFAKELLGPLPAGLAVQLLVWHPDALDRMRQARPYGLTVGLAALLLWITLRWCRSPGRLHWMLLWTTTAAALAWTHYLNLPLIAVLVVWLLGFPRLRVNGQQHPGWMLPVGICLFCLAIIPLAPSIFRLEDWSAALNFRQAPPSIWKGINPYWWLLLPVGMSLGWLLMRVIPGNNISLPLRPNLGLLILIGCLPVVVFAVVPAGGLSALAEPRYRLAFAPASVVLLAGCLMKDRNLSAAFLASVIGIAGAWWAQGERPWITKELSNPAATDWATLTMHLQKQGSPYEPVFVYSGLTESRLVPLLFNDLMFHDYVSCRAGRFVVDVPHPRYALPWSWSWHAPLIGFYESSLEQVRKRGQSTIWLIASTDTDLGRDTIEQFTNLVKSRRYRETERISTPNAALIKFEANTSS